MKKEILIILAICFISFSGFTQTVTVHHQYEANLDATNDTIEIPVDMYSGEAEIHLSVFNGTANDITFKARKTVIFEVDGSQNDICWAGNCFSQNITTSITSELVNAGEYSTQGFLGFVAHYQANGTFGTTIIDYSFFDINNEGVEYKTTVKWIHNEPDGIETDILTYSFAEQTGDAIINYVDHTVSIEVENCTDLTTVTPYITISNGATISPESGVVTDMSSPVVYTVTAEDTETVAYWLVTVNVLKPYNEQICMVTVDSLTGNNLVVWEKTFGERTDYYKIYRESNTMGVYDSIGFVPFNNLSVFSDEDVDPSSQSYLYKITCVDSCGHESDINSCDAHKTIHLQVSPSTTSGHELDWDEYVGFYYTSYEIYRAETGGEFSLVHTISASNSAWTDGSAPQASLEYRIAVVKEDACYPTSLTKEEVSYNISFSNMESNGTVEIEDNLMSKEISIYPNPSTGLINVTVPKQNSEASVLITDIIGKTIIKQQLNNKTTQFNLSELPKGIYLVKVKEGEMSKVEKIFLE